MHLPISYHHDVIDYVRVLRSSEDSTAWSLTHSSVHVILFKVVDVVNVEMVLLVLIRSIGTTLKGTKRTEK
jgi:hypothetical protein